MRVENQIRFNEWLLGSTILCQSCGCLWLVPAAQKDDSYLCRQCGSEVNSKPRPVTGDSQANVPTVSVLAVKRSATSGHKIQQRGVYLTEQASNLLFFQ